ncbi:MAG TPA: alpha/beta hydrolase, partial [Candidatus Limnocylindrales bacterium]|nr:alpha/beta hydrolase [Candidatus Limnocylindrales bacterium]
WLPERRRSMPYVKARDGTNIYYEATGKGKPFLFLSETACDGAVWNLYQTPEFSSDHCVVTLDYRGTGLSGKPSERYSTAMFAEDAVAVLDHLGLDGAVVCGHSMGGRVAQLLALDHPRKVSKLILASSGAAHPGDRGIPLRIAKEMAEWGYVKYVRDHTIVVGWTEEYARNHINDIENISRCAWPTCARWSFTSAMCWRARSMTAVDG